MHMMCFDKIYPIPSLVISPYHPKNFSLTTSSALVLNPLGPFNTTYLCMSVEQSNSTWVDLRVMSLKRTDVLFPAAISCQ